MTVSSQVPRTDVSLTIGSIGTVVCGEQQVPTQSEIDAFISLVAGILQRAGMNDGNSTHSTTPNEGESVS